MSQSDRAIKKFATQLARLDREVKSWRGAQADFTSIENGGNFTFKDGDGNVTAIMGGQDDGSNTIRHVDGPTPPIPSGLSAHVDGPIVQVSWDGSFEDADTATYDWSHLEVIAVGPNSENLRATINDVTGATANLAATASGEWTVVARSVSRAEKRSLDGDAGTVDVELVGLTGAINDAIGSANGKNTVTYSETAPTPADEGIVGDTWWVGQVGRPNDIIEATNLVFNPSFEVAPTGLVLSAGLTSAVQAADATGVVAGGSCLSVTGAASGIGTNTAQIAVYTSPGIVAGQYLGWGWSLRDASGSGLTVSTGVNWYTEGGAFISSEYQPYRPVSTSLGRLTSGFLVPATAYRARMIFRFRAADGASPAPANFNVLTDGWLSCSALTQAAALDAVSTYFDGDTTSGTTDDEPHYRWTGTPHASTSEKYLPAIPESGSDAWNITEQWQYTSAGWKPVEVSHQVIATVDLGKATVGELDGIRIMGQTVRGEQLSGDAIDGKVITGGTYRTTGGNGSWSDAGLFINQPDGTSMVRFPTDGTPLSLTASDTQIERASIGELDVSNGAVRSGGQFTLASGVTAPASPPELTTGWQKVASLQTPDVALTHDWLGLGYWAEGDGHWVRAVNVLGSEGDTLDTIHVYSVDGVFEQAIKTGLNPRSGVTVIGDVAYVMGPDYQQSNIGKQWVHGVDLNTGARVTRWEMVRFGGVRNRLALGTDGTNLVVAGVAPAPTLFVLRFNPATGAQVGSDWSTATGSWRGGQDIEGVHVSGSAFAGFEVTILPMQTARVYTVSGGSLIRKTDTANASGFAGWDNPNRNGAGMVWRVGSLGVNVPFVVDGAGDVYEGTQFSSDTNFSACFTWFNGTNQTTPSPMTVGSFPARSNPRFSMPARAGMQKRLYFNFGSWNYVTLPEDMTTFSWADVLDYGLSTGAPPTTNTFPAATPAVLKSNIGGFQVRGDGSGHWGPLTFNADGTMTSAAIPSWVPLTTFASGFAPQSWGFAPAYRLWPDGKVEWRGVIAGTATGTTTIATIPVEARSPQSVQFAAATGNPGAGYSGREMLTRIEFGSEGSPANMTVYPNGKPVPWVSLDGIYYYKS